MRASGNNVDEYVLTGAFHGNLLVKVLEESSTKEQLDNLWGWVVTSKG